MDSRPAVPAGPKRARSSSGSIRILVADDQPIDRKGLAGLLSTQPDFSVVGEAASSEEVLERCQSLRPDILLADLLTPGMDATEAMAAVRDASPGTRVIAIAERGERRCLVLNPPRPDRPWTATEGPACGTVTDCLQFAVLRGAHGAIRRSADPEELFRAVRAVAAGNAWYEPGTAARLLDRARETEARGARRGLSARQIDVSTLISEGRSNKEIGRALGITEATVKKHVREVLFKLGLQDRLQVGLYFARNPLLLSQRSGRTPALPAAPKG